MELFSWALQFITTLAVGAIGFFLKSTLAGTQKSIEKNDQEITNLRDELHNLKSDLPLVYTLREDFIRSMNNVESKMGGMDCKLDKLLERNTAQRGDKC